MPGIADIVFAGTDPARAKVLCIFVHGRNQAPEEMEAAGIRRLSAHGVAFALPRARARTCYTARAIDPLTETTRAELAQSLADLGTAIASVRARSPGTPLLLAGFSQGACLSFVRAFGGHQPPDALAAFTGCRVGTLADARPANRPPCPPVYLSAGSADPWIPVTAFAETVTDLGQAEANLRCDIFPACPHDVSLTEIPLRDGLLTDLAAGRTPRMEAPR